MVVGVQVALQLHGVLVLLVTNLTVERLHTVVVRTLCLPNTHCGSTHGGCVPCSSSSVSSPSQQPAAVWPVTANIKVHK